MDDYERSVVFSNLNLKETEELVDIWIENNKDEWTELALDIIREILIQRLGKLPTQKMVSDILVKSEENEPVFYNPDRVFELDRWLKIASVVIIGLIVLNSISQSEETFNFVFSLFNYRIPNVLCGFITGIFILSKIFFESIIYFFLIRGFCFVMNMLMEMEYNSRTSNS